MRRSLAIFASCAIAMACTATQASAASYRAGDVERAVAQTFDKGHGGGGASASCARRRGDTKWRCRVQRAPNMHSTPFTLTITAHGGWKTTRFWFSGLAARYTLHGCCLRRR